VSWRDVIVRTVSDVRDLQTPDFRNDPLVRPRAFRVGIGVLVFTASSIVAIIAHGTVHVVFVVLIFLGWLCVFSGAAPLIRDGLERD
jgi:hypothetical protein